MIAVTVVTPSYRHLEEEWVNRVKKHTGLPIKIIRCKDKEGFKTKLNLDKICGRQRIVFADVDLWFCQRVDFTKWDSSCWFAVQDAGVYNPEIFPRQDCELYRMDINRYFNSGLMIVNLALPSHRQVFQKARLFLKQITSGILPNQFYDSTDQSLLNFAAQKVGINLSILPQKFNYYHKNWEWGQVETIPRGIIGLHAAGYPVGEKLAALQMQEKVLCNIQRPMWPDAIRMRYAKIFDMA